MSVSTRTLNGLTFTVNNAITASEFLAKTAQMVAEEYPDTEWVIGRYSLHRECLDCGDPYEGQIDVSPMSRKERKVRDPKYYSPTVIYKNGKQVFFTHGTSVFHRLEDKP